MNKIKLGYLDWDAIPSSGKTKGFTDLHLAISPNLLYDKRLLTQYPSISYFSLCKKKCWAMLGIESLLFTCVLKVYSEEIVCFSVSVP